MSVQIAISLDIERPYKREGNITPTDKAEGASNLELLARVNSILDEHDASRTFFVLGGYLDQAANQFGENALKEALRHQDEKVEIAQETYSHPSIATLKTRSEIKPITPE